MVNALSVNFMSKYHILQTEAELLAEKKCVAHLTGEVNIAARIAVYANIFLLTMHIHDTHFNLNICILSYQGIAVCDLPGDTMLPGEM